MNASNFEDTVNTIAGGAITANTLAKINGSVGMYMNDGVSGDLIPFKILGRIVNATKVATQVWVALDPLYWDGTSAFTNIPNGTPPVGVAALAALSAAVVGDVDLLTGLGGPGDRITINTELLAASVDKWIFVANRAMKVISIREVHSVVGGAAAAVRPRKVTAASTEAPGAAASATCIELNSANIDLTATVNVSQTSTLSTTLADITLAAGDKIGLDFSGTLTGLVGLLSIELASV